MIRNDTITNSQTRNQSDGSKLKEEIENTRHTEAGSKIGETRQRVDILPFSLLSTSTLLIYSIKYTL